MPTTQKSPMRMKPHRAFLCFNTCCEVLEGKLLVVEFDLTTAYVTA